MRRILFTAALCSAMISFAQKTDSIIIFYQTDKFRLSEPDRIKLDSFMSRGWDRIIINGFTDETDEDEYNMELSRKRSVEVYKYFVSKKFPSTAIFYRYFGEARPVADNASEEGRSMNRRTTILGHQYPKLKSRPPAEPEKPLTRTLNNGFIITYLPGRLPWQIASSFEEGDGSNFLLLTNTVQMRQNNLYNNTTRGELLSSVLIICNNGFDPCLLDTPVVVRVPIPYKIKCDLVNVKFFIAVEENGKRIWQEQNKPLRPELINGQQYLSMETDNFCGCINFDFKIDPDCFETDSIPVQYVNAKIKNLSAELLEVNSVYLPRKINDSTHSIIFLKNKLNEALLSFSLYRNNRRIRSFKDEPLNAFPYDEATQQYLLTTGTYKFYFPRQKVWDVVLRVNKDRYRAYIEKNKCELTYLHRSTEEVLVDFSIIESRKKITQYRNIPIGSLPFNQATGYFEVDKNFLKLYKKEKEMKGLALVK